jgi:hypothetical protein
MPAKKKTSAEYDALVDLTKRVLSVPHSVIQQRIEEHRAEAANNPRKRGPKSKVK